MASETTGETVPLRIAAFTAGEIAANPAVFGELADPYGYVRGLDAQGRAMLATNPCYDPQDLALVLALDGATIVGRLGLYAGPAPQGLGLPRLLWLSGYFLQDRYRASGAGGMLMLRAMSARMPLLAAGGPNADLQRLYDSTGFVRLPPLQGFFFPLTSRPVVTRFAPPGAVRSLARIPAGSLVALYRLWHRPASLRTLQFVAVDRFAPDLDEAQARDPTALFPRDHRLLNWLLAHKPTTRGFLALRGGRPVGYCILGTRQMGRAGEGGESQAVWGMLVDYWLEEPDIPAMDDLLAFARRHFQERGVDAVYCQAADPLLPGSARRAGMLRYGGSLVFYRGGRHRVDPAGPWRLTAATADLSLYVD